MIRALKNTYLTVQYHLSRPGTTSSTYRLTLLDLVDPKWLVVIQQQLPMKSQLTSELLRKPPNTICTKYGTIETIRGISKAMLIFMKFQCVVNLENKYFSHIFQ